jgi:hypothetical protein
VEVLGREPPDQALERTHRAESPGQDVRDDARPLDQIELLEDHSDPLPRLAELGRGEPGQLKIVQPDLASGRLDQPVDAA